MEPLDTGGSKMSYSFDVLMIDPPWPKKKGGRRKVRPNQSVCLPYDTMSTDGIFSLLEDRVLYQASPAHTVFMWTVEQFLIECEQEMKTRGYKRHVRMVWDKGNGVAPAFTIRYAHEYLIWYYKPKMLPIAPSERGKFTSVIREASREHSRKPDAAYNIVDRLYPSDIYRKIDVFSREKRDGWAQFGNQNNYFPKGR